VQLARLAQAGVTRHLATGYYALVPHRRLADPTWQPDLHAVALGIAQADYGTDAVALMGISAARCHGAIPRALATAVVAVPKQRPALRTEVGQVLFPERDVTRLDVERIDTELTVGWITTIEQTLLDLAARPTLGGLTPDAATEAIHALITRADAGLLAELARDQHKPAAWRRIRQLMETAHA